MKLSPWQKQSRCKEKQAKWIMLVIHFFFLPVYICKCFYNEKYYWKKACKQNTRFMFKLENDVCWHFLVLMCRRYWGKSLSHDQLVPVNTPYFLMVQGWWRAGVLTHSPTIAQRKPCKCSLLTAYQLPQGLQKWHGQPQVLHNPLTRSLYQTLLGFFTTRERMSLKWSLSVAVHSGADSEDWAGLENNSESRKLTNFWRVLLLHKKMFVDIGIRKALRALKSNPDSL